MSKFNRFISKPLRLPINWALPRSAVGGVKEFKFSSSRYPICPNCSLSRFEKLPKEEGDKETTWECPSCHFECQTRGGNLADIQAWVRENAQAVFFNSEYQQERLNAYQHEDDETGFVAINIRRNMMACYAFLALVPILLMLFLYAAWNVYLFFMINALLFIVACSLMALIFNYHAWQAMTHCLYSDNGKEQFHWWIKNHPWFKQPQNIGLPPTFDKFDEDINADDNYQDTQDDTIDITKKDDF